MSTGGTLACPISYAFRLLCALRGAAPHNPLTLAL
jgi:hypothetical protein